MKSLNDSNGLILSSTTRINQIILVIFLFILSISLVSSLPATSMPSAINISELTLQRTLLTQETDYNSDGLPDVYTSFKQINNTLIEINVRQTNPNTKGGNAYKWASAICNKSSMTGLKYLQEDAQGGFNNAFPINLNYGKLVNYGLPATWCSANGGNGYVLFGGGSGDKNYRLIIPQGKNFDIMTGKGSEQVFYEWKNDTFTIYPTSDYQRDAFTIKIYDCSGNQMSYPDIAWMESNVSTDEKIVFYPHVGLTNLSCIRFRTNTLETPHFTTTSQFYTSTTPYYQLSFEDFESKNNITSRNVTIVHPTFIESFFDVFPFVWRVFSYQADTTYYDIEYRGNIVDLDPSLALTYSSSSDLLYANQTEGSNLGARLTAAVLSMDFNTPAENILNLGYQNGSLYQSGTYIKDGSVYNNYGTSSGLTAQYWWNGNTNGASKINGSLQFDGVNDYVGITSTPNLNYANSTNDLPFSISTWVRFNSVSTQQFILNKRTGTTGASEYQLFLGAGGTLSFTLLNGAGVTVYINRDSSGSTISANRWYHVVATYDGSANQSNMHIYVNGSLSDGTASMTGSYVRMSPTSAPLYLGMLGASVLPMNGSIDDVIIWGRALNSSEISTIYSEGLTGRTSPIDFSSVDTRTIPADSRVAYWSFNNNESGNATDSWSGINGTCTGTNCPTWVNNSILNISSSVMGNGSYSFNGGSTSGQYIKLSNFNVNTNQITMAAWVNLKSVPAANHGATIIAKSATAYGASPADPYQLWALSIDQNLKMYNSISTGVAGSRVSTTSTNSIQLNKWVFLVATYNGSIVKNYINGIQDPTTSSTTLTIGANNITPLLGEFGGNSYIDGFNGTIDEVMIFNKSLNSTEILNLYDQTRKKLHLQFDELSGAGAINIGDSLTNGTLTNYPTTSLTAPVYNATGGVNGSGAYIFDGVDDTITTGTTGLPTGSKARSVFVWINGNFSAGTRNTIYSYGNSVGITNNFFELHILTGKLGFRGYNNDFESTLSVSANQWHFVGAVYQENSNKMELWVDGVNQSGTITPLATVASISKFGVGADLAASKYNGSIDNVQIFNRALSAQEVMNLYNGTLANRTIKYSTKQGDFTSGVFYNTTQTYWNVSLATADTTNRSGIVNPDNSINLSNPNLVSYWALDGNYRDAKGVNNGTCSRTNCPNNASGLTSNAMRFDGVDDYINNEGIPNFGANANVTISLWAYPLTSGTTTLLLKGNGGICYAYGLGLSSGFLKSIVSSSDYTVGSGVNTNQWNHLVIVYNSSGAFGYVNGVYGTNSSASTTVTCTNLNTTIGQRLNAGSPGYFNGTLDEVLIYNTSLTASQVSQLYKSGLSQHANTNVTIQTRTANSYNISDSSLVAFWALNNDSSIGENATKFVDLKNGNNGSCSGATCPIINSSSGVIGNGANFNGNQELNISDSSLLKSSEVTISLWVNPRAFTGNLISKRNSAGAYISAYNIFINSSNVVLTCDVASTSNNLILGPLVPLNTWVHIVAYCGDSGRGMKLWTNGILRGNNSIAGLLNYGAQNHPIVFGRIENYGSAPFFNGSIDEVRIYNRSLSAAEVLNLYQLGSYHIEWDNNYSTETTVQDSAGTLTSASGKFMQFKTNLNSNTTDVSPYVNSYNVTSAESPTPLDTTYPTFTNQVNNYPNGSIYVYNRNYEFNITIDKTNGTAGIEFAGTNYSITNISNIFTYSNSTLDAGTYSYYYWAYGNGSLNLYNSSEVYSYTINKTTLVGAILGLGTFTYPKATSVSYTESNDGDTDVVYNWYRNSLAVSNPDAGTFAVDTYTYLLNSSGGINYNQNDSIASGNLVINQNTTYNLSLTADPSWYGTIGDWITVTGTGCPDELTCDLFRDNIQKFNPNIAQYFNGTYVFVFNTTGNTNYSAKSVSDTLYINYTNGGNVTSACPQIRFSYNNGYESQAVGSNCTSKVNFKYFNPKLPMIITN